MKPEVQAPEYTLSGPEFKKLRKLLGYTAGKMVSTFSKYVADASIGTNQGLYKLESRKKTVPVYYLKALEREVGSEWLRQAIARVRATA